jgi:uncharacterized protein
VFEWDEAKAEQNLAKHGLRFVDAVDVFDGRSVITRPSEKNGEARYVTIAKLDGRFVAVVWTQRQDKRRLISMRRARSDEERAYRVLHG